MYTGNGKLKTPELLQFLTFRDYKRTFRLPGHKFSCIKQEGKR